MMIWNSKTYIPICIGGLAVGVIIGMYIHQKIEKYKEMKQQEVKN